MTCVVAVSDPRRGTWMGADSAAIDGNYSVRTMVDPKVHEVGPMLLGYAGQLRPGQILAHHLRAPTPRGERPFEYVLRVAEAARGVLKRHEAMGRQDEKAQSGALLLIAYRQRLFVLEDDFDAHEPAEPYAAIGAGSDLALGALYASPELPPESRLERALLAAERFNASVRRPFSVLHQPMPRPPRKARTR